MPKICLYAEVLTHIRQLTLHASLQTNDEETPRIDVSSDKKVITVVHGGESSSLFLPTQISGTANVTFLTPRKTELTARVQIEDVQPWKQFDQGGTEAPWDAGELSNSTALKCRTCDAQILSPGGVRLWKDLPSQDWADLMDLWYCHKPHEHADSDQQKSAADAKGFSARSKLASVSGTGMVDVVSFVLHPDDCENVKITSSINDNDFKPVVVECSICHSTVGTFSSFENLIRLYKSNVSVQRTSTDAYISFPTSTFICAQLLSLIESTSIRKIVVHSTVPKNQTEVSGRDLNEPIAPSSSPIPNPSSSSSPVTSIEKRGEKRKSPDIEQDDTSQLYSTLPSNNSTSGQSNRETKPQNESNPYAATVEDCPSPQSSNMMSKKAPTTSSSSSSSSLPSASSSTTSTATKIPIAKHELSKSATENLPPSSGILLWIFNPDIYYSASLHPSCISTPSNPTARAHRAMKIFYKPLASPSTYLSSVPESQIEELHLPTEADVKSLRTALETSTQMLPESAQKFQDWDVGLLDRWEKQATANDVMAENPLARKPEDGDQDQSQGQGERRDGARSDRTTRWELPAGYQELYL